MKLASLPSDSHLSTTLADAIGITAISHTLHNFSGSLYSAGLEVTDQSAQYLVQLIGI